MTLKGPGFVALLATIGLFSGCGGCAEVMNHPCTGPTNSNAAVLNGSTLSGAGSSWTALSCNSAKLELTADGGLKYSLTAGGVQAAAQTTWSAFGDDGIQVSCGSTVLCLNSLTNISGSTCTQTFNAQVAIVSNGISDVGKCSFSLVDSPLP